MKEAISLLGGAEYSLLDAAEEGKAEQKVTEINEHWCVLVPINAEQQEVNDHISLEIDSYCT